MKESVKTNIYGCLAVIGGILIHFTLGHFYTVANMAPYIMSYIKVRVNPELGEKNSIWLSALALAIQGFSMPVGGIIAKKIGFRFVVALSCLLESGSVLLTYFTIQYTFVGVVITYALLLGGGLGLGYSVVLATAATWFPARRGLIVGMIVGGFGLGALVFTPIQTAFINPNNIKVDNTTRLFTDPVVLDNVPKAFLLLGGLLFGIQVIGFILLRPKPVTDAPKADEKIAAAQSEKKPLAIGKQDGGSPSASTEENVPPKQVLRRLDFYLLWLVMFCNIIPITLITSAYKMFGQQYISDDRFLAGIATTSALFNAGGRIMWGSIVDRISFKIPLFIMLAMWATILITFPHIALQSGIALKVLYAIWVCLLFLSLSGVFVIMPAATGNLFGPVNLAVNYGLVFNAFAAGSLLCALVTTLVESENIYVFQFTGCAAVCIVALILTIWIEDKKLPRMFNFCNICTNQCGRLRGRDPNEVRLEMGQPSSNM